MMACKPWKTDKKSKTLWLTLNTTEKERKKMDSISKSTGPSRKTSVMI